MLLGYIRVSTVRQADEGTSLEGQRQSLLDAGVAETAIYTDAGASGASLARPGLTALRKAARSGDTVVVAGLDRLGRSVADITSLLQGWAEQGVSLIALRDGVDTSTAAGTMVAQMLAVVAELERRLILERTAAGRRAAAESGRVCHRPRGWTDKQARRAAHYQHEGWGVSDIAARLHTSRGTVYRMLDRAAELDGGTDATHTEGASA